MSTEAVGPLTEAEQRDKDMQEAVRNARAAVRHQQEAYGYV